MKEHLLHEANSVVDARLLANTLNLQKYTDYEYKSVGRMVMCILPHAPKEIPSDIREKLGIFINGFMQGRDSLRSQRKRNE